MWMYCVNGDFAKHLNILASICKHIFVLIFERAVEKALAGGRKLYILG